MMRLYLTGRTPLVLIFFFFLQIKQQESKQTRENPTKIFILIITEEPQSALKIYW